MRLRLYPLFIFMILPAIYIHSQDLTYGIQGNLTFPKGDIAKLADERIGIGGGTHMKLGLNNGMWLRPKIELELLPSIDPDVQDVPTDSLSIGCDCLYYLDTSGHRFYGSAGLSLIRWRMNDHRQALKPGIMLGVGRDLSSKTALEIQYKNSRISGQLTANTWVAGIYHRF